MYKFLCCVLICSLLLSCNLTDEKRVKRNEYLQRAQFYYQNGKYNNALQQINLALEIDDDDKRARLSKGWTLYNLKKYDESEEWLKKALEKDDSDYWIHDGLGSVYFKKGVVEFDKLEVFDEKYRKNIIGYNKDKIAKSEETRAKFLAEANHWLNLSIEHFRTAIKLQKENALLYKKTAAVYEMQGLYYYSQALAFVSSQISLSEEGPIDTFLEKGLPAYQTAIGLLDDYLVRLKKGQEATQKLLVKKEEERKKVGLSRKEHERLDSVINDLKEQIVVLKEEYLIGQGLASSHAYDIAILMDQCQSFGSNKQALYAQKAAYYTKEARERTQRMLEISPFLVNAYHNLAKIAHLQGQYQVAIKYQKEYIKRYPLHDAKGKVIAKQELEELVRLASKTK